MLRSHTIAIAIAIAIAVTLATSAGAVDSVLVAPVQSSDGDEDELVLELEEALRVGASARAQALDFVVVSRNTLERSLDDLVAAGDDQAIGLPCANAQCDADLGRALGAQLVVSTRLMQRDGRYIALLRVLAADGDKALASASVQADTFGLLLSEASTQVERMLVSARAPAPPPRRIEERALRAGLLTITRDGETFGSAYDCQLSTTHLRCKSVGLFSSAKTLVISLAAVTAVSASGTVIALETTARTYKIDTASFRGTDRSAKVFENDLERQRAATELATWKADLDGAWRGLQES